MEALTNLYSLDYTIIYALLCLGFLIKHFVHKLSNSTIPGILLVTAFVIFIIKSVVYNEGTLLDAFYNSLIYSAISIGLHSGGKEFLNIFNKINPSSDNKEQNKH